MIGKKLKELLKDKNIKQIQLADHIKISPSRLSNYLSDKREPDLSILAKMAKFIGVDLNYFSDIPFDSSVSNNSIDRIPKIPQVTCVPVYQFKSKKRADSICTLRLDTLIAPEGCTAYEIEPNEYGDIFQNGATIITRKVSKDALSTGNYILVTGRNGGIYQYVSGNTFINLEHTKTIEITDDSLTHVMRIIAKCRGTYEIN